MLAKINIVKKQTEIELVKEKGRMYQSALFGMLVLKNEVEGNKFGFVISKKISKRAVDRNKIRRLMTESIRLNLEKIKNNVWVVFLAKRKILGLKQDGVRDEVEKMFQLVGII